MYDYFLTWCDCNSCQLLDAESLEILSKELGKVVPLWIITWEKYRLASEDIRIVLDICVHLFLYILILGIELIIFRFLCFGEITISGFLINLDWFGHKKWQLVIIAEIFSLVL